MTYRCVNTIDLHLAARVTKQPGDNAEDMITRSLNEWEAGGWTLVNVVSIAQGNERHRFTFYKGN